MFRFGVVGAFMFVQGKKKTQSKKIIMEYSSCKSPFSFESNRRIKSLLRKNITQIHGVHLECNMKSYFYD